MNKRIWIVVIPATVLGACSAQSQVAAPDNCQPGKKITINHGPRGIIVAPPNLCVKLGDTISVNTTPKNEPLDTVPTNNPGHNWLNGSNSGKKGEFTLQVPAEVPGCLDECTYKYTIKTDNIIFDPMITIRR